MAVFVTNTYVHRRKLASNMGAVAKSLLGVRHCNSAEKKIFLGRQNIVWAQPLPLPPPTQVTPMYMCIIWVAANHSFTQLNYQINMVLIIIII